MKKRTKQISVISIVMGLMFFSVMLVSAGECGSQDCTTDISITIGNTAPTIPYVNTDTITLTGGTTKTVYVIFNASDGNGYLDLDHSTAQVDIYKAGETTRTSSVCTATENSSLVSVFNCTVDMQFYDGDGIWNINASISDDSASKIENKTFEVTVDSLDYVSQDVVSVSGGAWATAVAGTDDNEADATITITNGGNQDYTTLEITAQNSTGLLSGVITAESFSVDDHTAETTGQVYMVDNTATDVTSVLTLSGHGSDVTEEIFFYVDLDNGLVADTYSSDSNWGISVST